MKNDLVSIIIPIFNAERTLEKCLNSVLNQKYSNFEVFLVNDGSVDNSSSICKRYSKKDSRFKYIEKKNGGVSSARNLALDKCKGSYVSYIDADDYINPYFLKYAMDLFKSTQSDIFICNFNFVNDSKKAQNVNFNAESNDVKIINKEDFLIKLVDGSGIGSGCANKIYKIGILKDIRFKEVAVAEDLYYNFEISKNNNDLKIVYSTQKLYNYYLNNNSVMHGKFLKKNLDVLEQYEKIINESNEKYINFNKAIKASYVFISSKIIIKMISSSVYDQKIIERCKSNIDKYKNLVYKNSKYSFSKKIFLTLFNVFFKKIINSYNKNNIWKKVCKFLNSKVG